jgi:aspartate/methionine/tyrosine aminotransferase
LAPPIPDFKTKSKSLRSRGGRTFDMSQAVPCYPTFPQIRESLATALGRDEVSFYTDVAGLSELRQAIIDGYWPTSDRNPDRVLVTAGANHAMVTTLMTLLATGDTVLLLEPYYFNYDMALPMLGLKADYLTLSPENGLQLDADAVIAHIEGNRGNKIRAIILVTPNNPSGSCYSSAEVMKLVRWTSSRDIELIIDETYRRFDPNHLNHSALAEFLGKGLTIVGSFSKSYSLTGYRVGYLLSSPDVIQQALKVQDTLIICPSHIGQLAALAGLRHCEADVQREAQRMSTIAEIVWSTAKKWTRFHLVSAGAFFAYLEHPFVDLNSTEASLKLYEETGILGLPGEVFGRKQARFIRLSISNVSQADTESALHALSEFDTRLKQEGT